MRHIILFLLVFLSPIANGISASTEWDALLKSNYTSAKIVRVSDGKVLFEQEPTKLLATASVTKLATAVTALKLYSPQHQFLTDFYYTGKRDGKAITGDLAVRGGGDPLLVSEKLWQLAADIKNLGIDEFRGGIIIDNSLFVDEPRDRSRKSAALSSENAYDAPLSALGINFNTVAINVVPDIKAGNLALLSTDPYPLKDIIIQNGIKTSSSSTGLSLVRNSKGDDTAINAQGQIKVNDNVRRLYRSIDNTTMINGEYIRAFLNGAGVKISGPVTAGKIPAQAKIFLTVKGYNLGYIVNGLNKYSNNYIADMLTKNIGANFGNRGDMKTGLGVITKFLKSTVGITTPFELHNGSGLDPENRFSSEQISQLLIFAAQNMDIFPELLASLPVAGQDGTLEKRFTAGAAAAMSGKVRAKTGTLSEPQATSSLAGYYQHKTHGLVAFSLICNAKENTNSSLTEQRRVLDASLARILQAM